jgi:hypothetical protein
LLAWGDQRVEPAAVRVGVHEERLDEQAGGTASSAPSGPITKLQKTRGRNVGVTDSPTASPTHFGWSSDWIMTLITE